MITSRPQTQARKLHGAAWSMRSWDEIMIARITATGEVADQCLETRAADSPLRTAVPLLLILRAGGGTGTTLTSVLMRHNLWGPASALQGLVRIVHDPQRATGR